MTPSRVCRKTCADTKPSSQHPCLSNTGILKPQNFANIFVTRYDGCARIWTSNLHTISGTKQGRRPKPPIKQEAAWLKITTPPKPNGVPRTATAKIRRRLRWPSCASLRQPMRKSPASDYGALHAHRVRAGWPVRGQLQWRSHKLTTNKYPTTE
jgi:hypothetical protein